MRACIAMARKGRWASLFLCLITSQVHAAEPRLDAAVRTVLHDTGVPAAAVALMRDGQPVLARGYGQRDLLAPGAAAGPDTLFKLGSLSKSVTALAVALLVDEGKLAWDVPVSRWLPELAEADPSVAALSLRQLLTHRSGLDLDRLEALLWPQPNAYTWADFLAGLAVLRSDPRPVTGFHYSNVNYALVGQLIQRTSGQGYARFVATRVFQPLGMDCTAGGFTRAGRPDLAQPHRMATGRPVPVRTDPPEVEEGLDAPAGGVRCSAKGLGRWLTFHQAPQADSLAALGLSAAGWHELHRADALVAQRFEPDGRPLAVEAYGLGLQFVGDDRGLRLDHYGGLAGISAYFAVYPARGLGLAVALNGDAPAARARIVAALQQALGLPAARAPAPRPPSPTPPPPMHTARLDAAQVQAWQGRYRDAWFGTVTLCPDGQGGLTWRSLASPRLVGQLARDDAGHVLLQWDDPSVQSDAWLDAASGDGAVTAFQLRAVSTPDFDFSALRLQRVGECLAER